MTRPRRRMVAAGLFLAGVAAVAWLEPRVIPGLLLAGGLLWLATTAVGASFFRGRSLQARGRHREAIERYRAFLAELEGNRRRLRWLWWSLYTSDPAALAENNIAASHLRLGEVDAADQAARRALGRDANYAMPFVNLSLGAALRGDSAAAELARAEAVRLGYSSGKLDRAVRATLAMHNQGVGRALEK